MSRTTNTISVLYVGDARDVADTAVTSLAIDDERIDLQTVETADEGIQRIVDGNIECLVSGYELPDATGIELLETVREQSPDLPFILYTDAGSEAVATAAVSAGVSAYLQPKTAPKLAERIVDLVEEYRAMRKQERDRERTADLFGKTERIATVGGWEIHPETMDVFWTDQLFDLHGVESDETLPLYGAIDNYHEEDRPIVEDAVEAALNDGEPFEIEARYCRPDGEVRWFRIQGMPTVDNGEIETVRGAVQDVTERRNRERVLKEMHNIISDRSHSFDDQIRKLLELGRTELGTEYGTLSHIRNEDYVYEVIVADDDSIQEGDIVPVSSTNCEIAASTKQTLVLGDVERDAPDETHRDGFTELGIACYLGAPVFVDDKVYGTFCFYGTEPRDGQFSEWEETLVDLMSRWVSYELQRRETTKQLHEQNRQLEQFASIVSHDLRNPLTIIDGYVTQAVETGDVTHLSATQSAIDRMETLIDDVLLLSRSKKEIGDHSSVALRSFVDQCWTTVPTDQATLTVTTDQVIRADESRLQQLLENLFRNAVEHGGESVSVVLGDLDDGFFVADNGPGIPEAERKTVFEDGYSTAREGTGLGLSIVAQIVDAHGWEIHLTESETGGTRFEITGVAIE